MQWMIPLECLLFSDLESFTYSTHGHDISEQISDVVSTLALFPFYTLHSRSVSTWLVLKPLTHHSILWHSAALYCGRLYHMSESAIVIVFYAIFQQIQLFTSYLFCKNLCDVNVRSRDETGLCGYTKGIQQIARCTMNATQQQSSGHVSLEK